MDARAHFPLDALRTINLRTSAVVSLSYSFFFSILFNDYFFYSLSSICFVVVAIFFSQPKDNVLVRCERI